MGPTRREIIALGGALALCGCAQQSIPMHPPASTGPVDAGPVSDFKAGGVYAQFRDTHSFFIVRRSGKVFAESAICTHRKCKLMAEADSFKCPCHGSTFTLEGAVTAGPARRDLPRLAVETNAAGHLIVHVERPFIPRDQWLSPEAFVT